MTMPMRERALAELGERRFDLLVVGGGIIGAGIAASASSAGGMARGPQWDASVAVKCSGRQPIEDGRAHGRLM